MLLDVTGLSKTYRGSDDPRPVFSDVSFSLGAGESVALTGESGSGKSTLLTLIAGLDRPDAGEIVIDGRSLTGLGDRDLAAIRRQRVGLVFQQFNLIPSMTVAANLGFQARLAGRYDAARLQDLADRLGLADHMDQFPEHLSGGQQQRVAIGRTLAARPGLVLADEPTGNLDEATGDVVLDLLLDLVGETGAGLLMVTHSTRLAARLDRRLHLSAGRIN